MKKPAAAGWVQGSAAEALFNQTQGKRHAERFAARGRHRAHDAENQIANPHCRHNQKADDYGHQNGSHDKTDGGGNAPVQRFFGLVLHISIVFFHQIQNQTGDKAKKDAAYPHQERHVFAVLTWLRCCCRCWLQGWAVIVLLVHSTLLKGI